MNEGAGPERREAERKHPDAAIAAPPQARSSAWPRSPTNVGVDAGCAPLSSASTPRRHSAEYALPASSTTASGTSRSGRFIALPRINEIDDRKHHRRHEEHGLPPQRQERALADRRDAEDREQRAARRAPLLPASVMRSRRQASGSRSARPVYEKKTSSSVTSAIVRCTMW